MSNNAIKVITVDIFLAEWQARPPDPDLCLSNKQREMPAGR